MNLFASREGGGPGDSGSITGASVESPGTLRPVRVTEALALATHVAEMIGRSRFFADFGDKDLEILTSFMQVFSASAGATIIREGEIEDYMLLIIAGRVEILKTDQLGHPQVMTRVGPGLTLGEMSMIDGEPRFATCMALEATTFATLDRDSMARIILEQPDLGAKLLVKLVTVLSQRLRQTSSTLLRFMER